ncbi:MAG: hypothetical protein ACJ75I_00305 [Solirubrobacterales bacterium]
MHGDPVHTAYLNAYRRVLGRGGDVRAVQGLAGSLAKKLDRGAQTAAANVRESFSKVTDNVEEMAGAAVVAHEAKDGTKWPLRAYATMNTETIGRTSSSRGVTDAVGTGGKVAIDIGECDLCNSLFSEEAIIGGDPVPPGHPGCTCSVIGPA